MTSVTTPEVRWYAAADGVAHAFRKGAQKAVRSLCDEPAWPRKFDWPARSRCLVCEHKIAAVEHMGRGGGLQSDSPTYRDDMRDAGRGELLR